MKQFELSKGPLLDEKGNLLEAGFSNEMVREYSRSAIKANKLKIKEWDYYYFGDSHFGVALTVADNSYMNLLSVSVLNFDDKSYTTKSHMKWFTLGKTNLPSSSKNGNIEVLTKSDTFIFKNDNGKRHLVVIFKKFKDGKTFFCDLDIEKDPSKSMVIATPFNKKKHFYYNQKINLLHAKGKFQIGNFLYEFKSGAYGVLDWGRGVWTYSNTWYWSSCSGECDGHKIGFNLGYGFGDTSKASENMLFVDDQAYKLDDVKFNIPLKNGKCSFLDKWEICSENKDISLQFEPLIDRYDNTNALIIQSNQHQVFGIFNGEFKINNHIYKICNIIGFAEKVKNRW